MNNAEILVKLSKCKLRAVGELSGYYLFAGEPRELSRMADWCSSKKIRPFHRDTNAGEIRVNMESVDNYLETKEKGFMTGARTGIL